MSRGMAFDSEFHNSKGNFLNTKEELIKDLVRRSDGRSEDRYNYQKGLRQELLPEFPGYVPKNPIYYAEADRALDYLAELRVKAGQVNKDTPFTAQFAPIRETFRAAFNLKQTVKNPGTAIVDILRAYSDGIGEGERARVRMMKEFYTQGYNYTVLVTDIYQAEKRDSPSWQINEKYRADVSRNRLESFFLGNGMVNLQHHVSDMITSMEKASKGAENRLRGSRIRGAVSIFGDDLGAISLPILDMSEPKVREKISNRWREYFYGNG